MAAALRETFAKAKAEGRCAFVPYVTAGFPTRDDTVPLMLALQECGADVIELGVPFSDPIADGPTVQRASFVALQNGVTILDIFEFIKVAREQGLTIPIILMGYYNPFSAFGDEALVKACAEATVSGFIVVDLPIDESAIFSAACKKYDLSFIPLVAPTSTDVRMAQIAEVSSGYVYCVSVTGVTGARKDLPPDLGDFLTRIRKHFDIPLAVGFGLSQPHHYQGVSKLAEGAVVGSALIKAIEEGHNTQERCDKVKAFCHNFLGTTPAAVADK